MENVPLILLINNVFISSDDKCFKSIKMKSLLSIFLLFLSSVFAYDYYITSPYSISAWQAGSTEAITWDLLDKRFADSITIDLMNGDLYNGNLIVNIASGLPGSASSFSWSIPTFLSGSDYFIRISGSGANGIVYRFSARFVIVGNGSSSSTVVITSSSVVTKTSTSTAQVTTTSIASTTSTSTVTLTSTSTSAIATSTASETSSSTATATKTASPTIIINAGNKVVKPNRFFLFLFPLFFLSVFLL